MRTLYWILTNNCTLSCKYCYYNCGISEKNICILDKDKILPKIKEFSKYFDRIVFTGGEALLSKDIFQLASECKKYNIKTSLLTNGILLTADVCKEIVSVFDRVSVSIDSLDPKLNDTMRGKFLVVKKGIDTLLTIRSINLEIEILQTISSVNYESIDEMIKFCKINNIKLWLNPVEVDLNSKSGFLSLEHLNKQEIKKFEKNFKKWIKFASGSNRNEKESLKQYLINTINLINKKSVKIKCKMGVENFVLQPDGNIYACFLRKDLAFGNIYKTELSGIMGNVKKADGNKIISDCARLGCLCLSDF